MRRTVAVVGAAAIFAAGIGLGTMLGGAGSDPDDDPGPVSLPDGLELAGALTSFDACDDYLDYVQEHALELVTPYGLHGGPMMGRGEMATDDMAVEESADGGADTDAAAAPTAGTTPDGVSGTNVQEQGVDEPDRLKTDGEVVYTTIGGRLRVLDITEDSPKELATLDLQGGWGAELLLAGDRLLVTSGGGPVIPFAGESFGRESSMPVPGGGATTLTSIDVSDPADPEVTERLTLDGATLSSRMVDGVARVVIRTEPGINLPWSQPEASGLRAERESLEANRELIRESEAADWLPYFVHETADGDEQEGILIDCERVAHPATFSGLGTLSVLTVELGDGSLLPDAGGVGVLAGGDTVYASPERLYVATRRFIDPEIFEEAASGDRPSELEELGTEIHAFDISGPSSTEYLASGEVPGVLLDQWALSEHEGVLRVASTIGDRWWGGGEDSSSLVTTLKQQGDELVQQGQVGDLGPTERIYAVRFMGDVGYVVTFRQTDPLYVLDLSDPTAPEATGELKIAGYSAYLHPIGDGLLLGVGQDAEEDTGRTLGTQVSLFDVADPANPERLDTLTVADSGSDVEHDHRAFLHWPDTGLTVVPLTRWWHPESEDAELPQGPPNGALAFTASREGGFAPAAGDDPEALVLTHADDELVKEGATSSDAELIDRWHSQYDAAIQRSMVVGDRLLTFSEREVVTHDLDSLEEQGSLALR